MEIIILRHGKVNYPPIRIISSSEFIDWVEAYNSNDLDMSVRPTRNALDTIQYANAVICSELPRSQASALALGAKDIHVKDALFNEADLPITEGKYIRLSVRLWAIIYRLMWFGGYSNNSESLKDTRLRAQKATNKLLETAEEHKKVVFVGHGIINHLIAKELLTQGWQGPKSPGRKYWEYGVYKYKL